MRPVKTKKVIEILTSLGCTAGKTVGDHQKWTAPGGHATSVPIGDKQVAPGTLRGIQRHLAPEFGERWLEEAMSQ